MKNRIYDITNKRYGRLVAIKKVSKSGQAKWLFKCDCGNEKVIMGLNVRRGVTRSCGCYMREVNAKLRFKHGLNKTHFHRIWSGMKNRCKNHKADSSKYYFEKGITYCPEWEVFENFYNDMFSTYKDGYSLDRIDNQKGYYKENCRWVPLARQAVNTSTNRYVMVNGKEYALIDAVKEYSKISYEAVRRRMDAGWNHIDALVLPMYHTRRGFK